ncbi:hypothetical protein [Faecalibaculum rodentium]|uniref:Uncharacterized protein n=1 Tax=Faecalibaculum rodentium TaxID=1702221 RepID=A0A140DUM4_9FIRM|nr:hypothetical protein [Faecalibaculum rodentium]AMK54351.1 hypothetical protein AALO17_12170 [Faecalibaculum rodentium]
MKHAFLLIMTLIAITVVAVLMISPPADIVEFVRSRLEDSEINGTGLITLAVLGLTLIAVYICLSSKFPAVKNRIWIPLGWIWELAFLFLCYGKSPELPDRLIQHFGFSIVMGIGLWIMLKQQCRSGSDS